MRQLLLIIQLNFPSFSACKIIETSSKSREMLRSLLSTGLLLTVYRAALSVAAPEGEPRELSSPQHKVFRAERMRIDSKKNFKILSNFF